MPELARHSIDLALVDLPYGATHQNWDKILPPFPMWKAFEHCCKPTANIVLFATNPFAAMLIASQPDWFRYDFAWEKNKPTGHLNCKVMPMRKHELVLVFRQQGNGIYQPQMTRGHDPVHTFTKHSIASPGTYGAQKNGNSGGGATTRYPTSVLRFDMVPSGSKHRCHPNEKPVAMLENLIRTYSRSGDVVLDCTMGSDSTGVASILNGRHFVGIEMDERYSAIAAMRIGEALKGTWRKLRVW